MQKKLTKWITEYIEHYKNQHMSVTIWNKPLISFVDAKDKRFYNLKETVNPAHLMPNDLLPNARSVIVYFVPFTHNVTKSNLNSGISSREWAYACVETNKLIAHINRYLHEKLKDYGYTCTNLPATHNFDEKKLISSWSHRHIAEIAGLGGFGLHRLLITDAGCSGRLGSIVTDIPLNVEPVLPKTYCLYYLNGSCKKCIEKCPAGALTLEKFDRFKCYEYLLKNAELHADIVLADVCGKCISGVPCSHKNPVREDE
ncbi:epoxyqueuosine reductase [Thermosyntropha sp.]|uniref:epoxyqueuosine reductase n=1 Tax=Thermosyntropha sp. TaxID=2740820 RepID=UPI0025D5ED84|nr:epoxyqueuosine reductase [Thermosyntropha sp.]MBO8158158.1 epoxyqueuosine reductase [Thermosyntropha sp.]